MENKRDRSIDSNASRGNKVRGERYTWINILKRLPLLILIPIAIFLPRLVRNSPEKVERIYSRGIYPIISRVLGFINSLIPLSVAELVIVFIGGLLVIILIVRLLKIPFGKLLSRRENRIRFFSYLVSLGIFAGVMLNLFYVLYLFQQPQLEMFLLSHILVLN